MQTTNKQFTHVENFLYLVDIIGESIGLNVPQIVEIEKLRSLPPNTLGHTLVEFLQSNQLSPLTTGPRRKQLHDSVHVITGYGIDPIGEAEVQAFLLGSKFHLAQIILGLGLLGIITKQIVNTPNNHSYNHILQRLWNAYQRGCNSQFNIDTWKPELQWHLPLTQVQLELTIN